MYQFGFIGMGNMGSAMLKGCLSVFPANTLAFSRKDAAKGEALSLETGAVWIDSNRTCAEQSRSEAVPWFIRAYCPRHAEYAGDGG